MTRKKKKLVKKLKKQLLNRRRIQTAKEEVREELKFGYVLTSELV